MQNATEQADRIVGELGERPVAAMAYSTAWAARLTTDDRPVFPQAREWLRRHQHADGSWGGSVPNAYDRLVSTVAAVLALHESPEDWAADAARAGVSYLRDHGADWRGAVGEPIGFEVVAPHLFEQARAAGLLSLDSLAELARLRDDKLSRVPPGALAKQPTGLLYSLEALGDLVPLPGMAGFAAVNGSMANNPAATGALWSATKDAAALDYLHAAARSAGGGGMPEIYPINVFEPSWVIYTLGRADLFPVGAKKHVERLVELAGTTSAPLGVSEEFPVPDSDDTAMVANVSHAFGYEATPLLESLLSFETDDHFVGFAHERGAPGERERPRPGGVRPAAAAVRPADRQGQGLPAGRARRVGLVVRQVAPVGLLRDRAGGLRAGRHRRGGLARRHLAVAAGRPAPGRLLGPARRAARGDRVRRAQPGRPRPAPRAGARGRLPPGRTPTCASTSTRPTTPSCGSARASTRRRRSCVRPSSPPAC